MIKRIKRALAAFLREELLETIGYQHNYPSTPIEHFHIENIPFETVVMERSIDLRSDEFSNLNPFKIDKTIERIKHEFAHELLTHIHVDAQDLVHVEYGRLKAIRLILRVQRVKR